LETGGRGAAPACRRTAPGSVGDAPGPESPGECPRGADLARSAPRGPFAEDGWRPRRRADHVAVMAIGPWTAVARGLATTSPPRHATPSAPARRLRRGRRLQRDGDVPGAGVRARRHDRVGRRVVRRTALADVCAAVPARVPAAARAAVSAAATPAAVPTGAAKWIPPRPRRRPRRRGRSHQGRPRCRRCCRPVRTRRRPRRIARGCWRRPPPLKPPPPPPGWIAPVVAQPVPGSFATMPRPSFPPYHPSVPPPPPPPPARSSVLFGPTTKVPPPPRLPTAPLTAGGAVAALAADEEGVRLPRREQERPRRARAPAPAGTVTGGNVGPAAGRAGRRDQVRAGRGRREGLRAAGVV
jgi:hypothetical protein